MTIEGEPKGGWIPEQKISITDALKAYTQGGAFSSLEENLKGKIAPGYLRIYCAFSRSLSIDP